LKKKKIFIEIDDVEIFNFSPCAKERYKNKFCHLKRKCEKKKKKKN
jgi:hypothetical protein